MGSATPDVRVRLSAEGVQDVVNAFRTISAEGTKATKETAEGVKLLTNINLAEWAMRAVEAFKQFAEASLEMQESIAKLSTVTGMSAETLSVLQRAARLNDGDITDMGLAFKKLSTSVDELYAKSPKMVAMFGRMGLKIKDLAGLNPDQLFIKVATALGGVSEEGERSAIASALFGKSTQQLLLISDQLATKGFPEMEKEARAMGEVFSKDDVEAAEKFNQKLKDLKLSAEAFAGRAVTAAATFAERWGAAMAMASAPSYAVQQMGVLPGTIAQAGAGPTVDAAAQAEEARKAAEKQEKQRLADLQKVQAQERAQETAHADAMTKLRTDAAKTAAAQVLAIRQLEIAREASADDAAYAQGLMSLNTYYDKRRDRIKADTDAEITNLEARKAATQRETGAELAAINAQIGVQKALNGAAADTSDLEAQRNQVAVAGRNKVLDIENQIALVRKKADNESSANEQGRTAAEIESATQRLNLQQKLADAQGNTYQAALTGIKLEADALAKALHTTVDDPQIKQLIGLLTGQAISANFAQQFATQLASVRSNLSGLDIFQQGLQNQVANGSMFPAQAQAAYTKAVQAQLPLLQEHLNVLKESAQTELDAAYAALSAAKATGQDTTQTRDAVNAAMEHVQALEQEQQKLNQAKLAANFMAQQMAYLKTAVQDAMQNDLAQWLSSGIDQADGFVDAMRALALSVVQSMRQILAQVVANIAIYALLNKLGIQPKDQSGDANKMMLASVMMGTGGAIVSEAATKLQNAAGELMSAAVMLMVANSIGGGSGFADGGLVSGPGTETSDSITARLSDGEFVVRAAAVRRFGVSTLNAINRGIMPVSVSQMGTPRFADGGLVDLTGNGSSSRNAALSATLDVDPALLLKRLEATDDWARVHVRTTQNNRRAVKAALGN